MVILLIVARRGIVSVCHNNDLVFFVSAGSLCWEFFELCCLEAKSRLLAIARALVLPEV